MTKVRLPGWVPTIDGQRREHQVVGTPNRDHGGRVAAKAALDVLRRRIGAQPVP